MPAQRHGVQATGAARQWPVILLLAVQLINGLIISAQRTFFPIYTTEALSLATAITASFVSLAQAAGIVAAVVGGSLVDSLGRKRTLVAGLMGFVLSGLAFFVRLPWLVSGLWLVNGLAVSLTSLGAQSYLIGVAGGQHLGLSSALYHWGFTLGGAAGSQIAGGLLDRRGYGAFGLAVVGASALNAAIAATLMPRLGAKRPKSTTPSRREVLVDYARLLRQPTVVHLGLMRFLPTCYYGTMMVLMPLLIFGETGTKSSVAAFAATSQVLAALAQLMVGRAADRIGPRIPTFTAMAVLALGALGQALLANAVWGLFLFGCLGTAAAWSLSALMPVLVSRSVSYERQGRVLGTLSVLWNLAMTLSTLLGGVLVTVRPGLPFAVAFVLVFAGLIVVVSYFRRQSRNSATTA